MSHLSDQYQVILASGSPRRRELLTQIGIEYEVMVSSADENCEEEKPELLVAELSFRKAAAVFGELNHESEYRNDSADKTPQNAKPYLVIGADTIVACDGQILGKPADAQEACRMLRTLQGRSHDVFTGVTIISESGNITFYEKTKVIFAPMSEAEIAEYVATGDPLDKAGAYGIQGFCARYISGIEGDYNNVVGLPVGRLYRELHLMGMM